jgi:hypothetical protein
MHDTLLHGLGDSLSGYKRDVPGMTRWYFLHIIPGNNHPVFLKVREKKKEKEISVPR